MFANIKQHLQCVIEACLSRFLMMYWSVMYLHLFVFVHLEVVESLLSVVCVFVCVLQTGPVDLSVQAKCEPCLSNPCKNDGTCSNDPVHYYRCTCPYGFKVNNHRQLKDRCRYSEHNRLRALNPCSLGPRWLVIKMRKSCSVCRLHSGPELWGAHPRLHQ